MNQKFENLSLSDQSHVKSVLILKKESKAKKRKVACIVGIPSEDNSTGVILCTGINHMFQEAFDGNCEDSKGETIPYVVHAEEQAIYRFNRHNEYHYSRIKKENKVISDVTIYVTYSPCIGCCKAIAMSGIKRIVFVDKHSSNFDNTPYAPQDFLNQMGIKFIHTTVPLSIRRGLENENQDKLDDTNFVKVGGDFKHITNK